MPPATKALKAIYYTEDMNRAPRCHLCHFCHHGICETPLNKVSADTTDVPFFAIQAPPALEREATQLEQLPDVPPPVAIGTAVAEAPSLPPPRLVKPCVVCSHPDRAAIEQDMLVTGLSYAILRRTYGVRGPLLSAHRRVCLGYPTMSRHESGGRRGTPRSAKTRGSAPGVSPAALKPTPRSRATAAQHTHDANFLRLVRTEIERLEAALVSSSMQIGVLMQQKMQAAVQAESLRKYLLVSEEQERGLDG